MKDTIFTNHAKHRCQNRGIPPKVVKFIIDHGRSREKCAVLALHAVEGHELDNVKRSEAHELDKI